MKNSLPLAGLLLASMSARALADHGYIAYPSIPISEARPPSDCARYLHGECKNWRIGAWLPTLLPDGFEPWRKHRAAKVGFMDGFIYEGTAPHGPGWSALQGNPADGTPFSYGTAGPPRGKLVYDYRNAVAFYSQGCCSWHSTVLAARVAAPPLRAIARSLIKVRTIRGIALGADVRRVESVYGKAVLQRLSAPSGMTMLSYAHPTSAQCGQFQNFGFFRGRLVYIELLNGC